MNKWKPTLGWRCPCGVCAEPVRRKREANMPDLPPEDPRFA